MVERKPGKSETEREIVRRVLKEAGIALRDGSAYADLVRPGPDLEAARVELAALRLDPPLSETIIQERHED